MNPDLFWIPGPWRGRLAVATRPRGGDWLEDEVNGWRRAGLDVVRTGDVGHGRRESYKGGERSTRTRHSRDSGAASMD